MTSSRCACAHTHTHPLRASTSTLHSKKPPAVAPATDDHERPAEEAVQGSLGVAANRFCATATCVLCELVHFHCRQRRNSRVKMLYMIGLGLGNEKDITVAGLEAVRSCDKLFLEHYTSVLCVSAAELVRMASSASPASLNV